MRFWACIVTLILCGAGLGAIVEDQLGRSRYVAPADAIPMPHAWQVRVVPPGSAYESTDGIIGPSLKQALRNAVVAARDEPGTFSGAGEGWLSAHYVMTKPCSRASDDGPAWDVYCNTRVVGPDKRALQLLTP